MKFNATWTTSPAVMATRFPMMPKKIRAIVAGGLEEIGNEAKSTLKQNTPGKKLPKKWRMRRSMSPAHIRITIYNSDKRANKLIPLKDGRSTNLLEILEYGTSPSQPIKPVRAKALRFVVDGKVVFASKVIPRGVRPYSFMRITYHKTKRNMIRLQGVVVGKLFVMLKTGRI